MLPSSWVRYGTDRRTVVAYGENAWSFGTSRSVGARDADTSDQLTQASRPSAFPGSASLTATRPLRSGLPASANEANRGTIPITSAAVSSDDHSFAARMLVTKWGASAKAPTSLAGTQAVSASRPPPSPPKLTFSQLGCVSTI